MCRMQRYPCIFDSACMWQNLLVDEYALHLRTVHKVPTYHTARQLLCISQIPYMALFRTMEEHWFLLLIRHSVDTQLVMISLVQLTLDIPFRSVRMTIEIQSADMKVTSTVRPIHLSSNIDFEVQAKRAIVLPWHTLQACVEQNQIAMHTHLFV